MEDNGTIHFDEFEIDPARRLFTRAGDVIPLGAKAFDLLMVLVENQGRVLSKDELLDTVWAGQFIEENNLTVHIAAIRKALGEKKGENRYIVTVPGKGYQFVGDLNGNGQAEIVVESREFHRIVIDEPLASDASRRLGSVGDRKYLIGGAVLLFALAGLSAYLLLTRQETSAVRARQLAPRIFPVTGGIPQRVAISRDGRTLAYSRRHKGKDSIWLADIENVSSIQLTEDAYRLHDELEFSADGRTVFFTAKDESHPTFTLMRVSAFGGSPEKLVSDVTGGIAVSNGNQLAYFKPASEGGNALYIANEDGSGEKMLLLLEHPQRFQSNKLSWSPSEDSVTVAMSNEDGSGCEFTGVSVKDGSMRRIGQGLCSGVVNFSWLDDGSGLVATQRSQWNADRSDLMLIDIDSGNRTPLSSEADSYTSRSLSSSAGSRVAILDIRNLPNVMTSALGDSIAARTLLQGTVRQEGIQGLVEAPDGKILFTVAVGLTREIWQMNRDGTEPKELIAAKDESQNSQVGVTKDNRYIVFESDRSGKSEIWRANRDGSNLKILTDGGNNTAPAVMADGTAFLYSCERNGRSEIWRCPIEGGQPTQLTTEGCSWPEISPDGSSFACATGTEGSSTPRYVDIYSLETGERVSRFKVTVSAALYNRIRWSKDGQSILYKDIVEGLWRQPLSGLAPERVLGFDGVRVFHFTNTLEGHLLYSGGVQMRQIVILEPTSTR